MSDSTNNTYQITQPQYNYIPPQTTSTVNAYQNTPIYQQILQDIKVLNNKDFNDKYGISKTDMSNAIIDVNKAFGNDNTNTINEIKMSIGYSERKEKLKLTQNTIDEVNNAPSSEKSKEIAVRTELAVAIYSNIKKTSNSFKDITIEIRTSNDDPKRYMITVTIIDPNDVKYQVKMLNLNPENKSEISSESKILGIIISAFRDIPQAKYGNIEIKRNNDGKFDATIYVKDVNGQIHKIELKNLDPNNEIETKQKIDGAIEELNKEIENSSLAKDLFGKTFPLYSKSKDGFILSNAEPTQQQFAKLETLLNLALIIENAKKQLLDNLAEQQKKAKEEDKIYEKKLEQKKAEKKIIEKKIEEKIIEAKMEAKHFETVANHNISIDLNEYRRAELKKLYAEIDAKEGGKK